MIKKINKLPPKNSIKEKIKKWLNIFFSIIFYILFIGLGYHLIKNFDYYFNLGKNKIESRINRESNIEGEEEGLISGERINENKEEKIEYITVEISGAILKPGVYKLKKGATLNDLIIEAGGVLKNGNQSNINRAEKLVDGEKINIPFKFNYDEYVKNKRLITTEDIKFQKIKSNEENVSSSNAKKSGKININTATKEELMTLPGIGPRTAENIIEYRKINKFQKQEDIMKVKRIGKKIYENLADKITVK